MDRRCAGLAAAASTRRRSRALRARRSARDRLEAALVALGARVNGDGPAPRMCEPAMAGVARPRARRGARPGGGVGLERFMHAGIPLAAAISV